MRQLFDGEGSTFREHLIINNIIEPGFDLNIERPFAAFYFDEEHKFTMLGERPLLYILVHIKYKDGQQRESKFCRFYSTRDNLSVEHQCVLVPDE